MKRSRMGGEEKKKSGGVRNLNLQQNSTFTKLLVPRVKRDTRFRGKNELREAEGKGF